MEEYIRSMFTDEEWALLKEDEPSLCARVMALPTKKQPNDERMREADESLAGTFKKL